MRIWWVLPVRGLAAQSFFPLQAEREFRQSPRQRESAWRRIFLQRERAMRGRAILQNVIALWSVNSMYFF